MNRPYRTRYVLLLLGGSCVAGAAAFWLGSLVWPAAEGAGLLVQADQDWFRPLVEKCNPLREQLHRLSP